MFCFDNASPEKSYFVDGLDCFISLCLLVFVFLNATIVQRSRLRENSGCMEFFETKEVSMRSPRELKFVRYILRLKDLTKSFKRRAYVMSGGVPTRLPAQYLPQGKEKLLLRDILSQKKKLFTSACTLLRLNRTKQILRWKYFGE